MLLRTQAAIYCLVNVLKERNEQQLVQCVLVMGSDIAERTYTHCHGNGCSFLSRRGQSTDIALCTVCLLCMSAPGGSMWSYGAEGHYFVCTRTWHR